MRSLFLAMLLVLGSIAPAPVWSQQGHWEKVPEALSEIGKIKDCNNFDLAYKLLHKEFLRLALLERAMKLFKDSKPPGPWDNLWFGPPFSTSVNGGRRKVGEIGGDYTQHEVRTALLRLSESQQKLEAQAINGKVDWEKFIVEEQRQGIEKIKSIYQLLGEPDTYETIDWKSGVIPIDPPAQAAQAESEIDPICQNSSAAPYLHHLASYWSLEEARSDKYFNVKIKDSEILELSQEKPSTSQAKSTHSKAMRSLQSERAQILEQYHTLKDSQELILKGLQRVSVIPTPKKTTRKQSNPKAPKKEILMDGRLEKKFVDADGSGNRFRIFDTVTKLTWHDIYGPKEIKDFYETMSPKPTFKFDGRQYPDYFKAASALCVSKGLQAPTKEELKVLEANFELAKNLGMDKGWFWSSSESSSSYVWAFSSNTGYVYDDCRRYFDDLSVRCVSGSRTK